MAIRRLEWDKTIKRLAALLSGGAALVSILSFIAGRRSAPAMAASVPTVELDRLELLPRADTAFALGDTLRLTAIAADARGVALLPGRIQWQSDDSAVAVVDSAGRVEARGAGHASIIVLAGARIARAHIWVLPRPTELVIPGDSIVQVAEGESRRLPVEVRDARGNRIAAAGLQWTAADRAVLTTDSTGELRALTPGSTVVSATLGELLVQRRVEVIPVPASLTLGGGAAQRAAAGERLPVALQVQVVSRSGRPVPGVTVRFDATPNGGLVAPDSALADSAGVVRARWTLGSRPGRQQVSVSVPGVDSPLVVTAEADPLPAGTKVAVQADSLSAPVLGTLAEPVVVQLSDTSGVALADVPVAWKALDGGEVVALSARSDSLGMVLGRWTLGPKSGPQRLRIQVGNARRFPPRVVTAVARSAPAARLSLVSGDRQLGTVGKPIPREVVLRVSDSLGNPVGDAPVRFGRGGRAAEDSVVRSGSDGRVRLRWTLAQTAGPDRVTASLVGGRDSVRLAATARPGAVDSIRFVGAPASAVAGRALSRAMAVRVADRYGNPVPGASVKLAATAGRLAVSRAVTDSLGVAAVRWTPGATAGRQTLSATVAGGSLWARHAVTVSAPPPTKRAAAAPPPKPAAEPKPASARSPFGT